MDVKYICPCPPHISLGPDREVAAKTISGWGMGGAVTARESFGLTDDKLGEDRGERRKRITGGGQ